MNKRLLKDLLNLKIGSKVEINSTVWTVKKRIHYDKPNEYEPAFTGYELDDDYFLNFEIYTGKIEESISSFGKSITKKGWFGFTTTTSKITPIKKIKVIKK